MTLKKDDFQTIGQFFTEKNVFENTAFLAWWKLISKKDKKAVLEPFAGKNGIVDMLKSIDWIDKKTKYISYDILPGRKDVEFRDTIESFPIGYNVAVTNPPFLAKNSATRKGLKNKIDPYSDLYEVCLFKCLDNLEYVAMIVPESFITTPYFKNRLFAVVSLTHKKIFKHTEQPVCLALFVKDETKDFLIYKNDILIGSFSELKMRESRFCKDLSSSSLFEISFHKTDGQLGFISTDATNHLKKLKIVNPSEILESDVNPYARLRTRIKITKNGKLIRVSISFIKNFNSYINEYRAETGDVFLTSFKGLRDDGSYRRRMSFLKLRELLLNFLQINHF